MKITLNTFIASSIMICSGHAATINAQNQAVDFGQSRLIVDSLNNVLSSGYGAIGYFSNLSTTLDFQGASGSSLETDFNILGSATLDFSSPANGIFQISGSDSIINGGLNNDFIGQLAYVVIGNAATLAASTEAFIYATGFTFAADPAQPGVTVDISVDPITNDFNSSNGQILLGGGSGVADVIIGQNNFGTVTNALQTAVLVPEPSSMLLSLVGGMLLMRRKR